MEKMAETPPISHDGEKKKASVGSRLLFTPPFADLRLQTQG